VGNGGENCNPQQLNLYRFLEKTKWVAIDIKPHYKYATAECILVHGKN
jgi:hypothetical protein